jgi:uncharacterized membrane protein
MSTHQVPVELVVAAWPDVDAAGRALDELRAAKQEHVIGIVEAATIVVDAQGKLRITDTRDMGPGKGAVVGGLLGAGLGVITGGVGWLLVGGSAVGALAAKARDGGLPDDRLRELGEQLAPNSSAIVAVIEHSWVAEVERELASAGADVVREAVEADLAAQLRAGSAVAWTATTDVDGDVVATRATAPGHPAETGPAAVPAQRSPAEVEAETPVGERKGS